MKLPDELLEAKDAALEDRRAATIAEDAFFWKVTRHVESVHGVAEGGAYWIWLRRKDTRRKTPCLVEEVSVEWCGDARDEVAVTLRAYAMRADGNWGEKVSVVDILDVVGPVRAGDDVDTWRQQPWEKA